MSVQSPRRSTQQAQLDAIRRLRGGEPPPLRASGDYAGLVTRALALALDAVVVWGTAALVGVVVGLGVSLLHLPGKADAVIAACIAGLSLLWSVGYFVFFWSTTGQTPGSRVMSIAVLDARGRGPLKPRRSLLRFAGLCIAAIPLGAGLLIMLWDSRARCLQDRLARTVVVYVAQQGDSFFAGPAGSSPPHGRAERDASKRLAGG